MLTLICESSFKYVHICRFVHIYIHTHVMKTERRLFGEEEDL